MSATNTESKSASKRESERSLPTSPIANAVDSILHVGPSTVPSIASVDLANESTQEFKSQAESRINVHESCDR
ncbi:hypothetical protein N7534_008489 [Penicillium rubens]|nr:hypothetical protein N7534_008489 [Penicillium rubens]